ncbi:MAG: hypothetical protein ACF8XB_14410 [Planctomycetota bacterium JB042]
MFSIVVLASLSVMQEEAAPAEARPVDALVAACRPLAEAESYRFTMTVENDGGRGGPQVVEGAVERAGPLHLKTEQGELLVLGEKVASLGEDGAWTAPPARGERPPRGEGGGRGARGEGGGPPEADGERPRRGGRGERGGRGRGGPERMLRSFRAPHTLLSDLPRFVEEVTRTEGEDGTVTFDGALSEEAVAVLGSGERGGRGGRGGRFGGDAVMENTGRFSVTLDAQGVPVELAYSVRTQAVFGDREIDRTRSTTFRVADLGAAKVRVPEDAAELLGIEPTPEASEDEWF